MLESEKLYPRPTACSLAVAAFLVCGSAAAQSTGGVVTAAPDRVWFKKSAEATPDSVQRIGAAPSPLTPYVAPGGPTPAPTPAPGPTPGPGPGLAPTPGPVSGPTPSGPVFDHQACIGTTLVNIYDDNSEQVVAYNSASCPAPVVGTPVSYNTVCNGSSGATTVLGSDGSSYIGQFSAACVPAAPAPDNTSQFCNAGVSYIRTTYGAGGYSDAVGGNACPPVSPPGTLSSQCEGNDYVVRYSNGTADVTPGYCAPPPPTCQQLGTCLVPPVPPTPISSKCEGNDYVIRYSDGTTDVTPGYCAPPPPPAVYPISSQCEGANYVTRYNNGSADVIPNYTYCAPPPPPPPYAISSQCEGRDYVIRYSNGAADVMPGFCAPAPTPAPTPPPPPPPSATCYYYYIDFGFELNEGGPFATYNEAYSVVRSFPTKPSSVFSGAC